MKTKIQDYTTSDVKHNEGDRDVTIECNENDWFFDWFSQILELHKIFEKKQLVSWINPVSFLFDFRFYCIFFRLGQTTFLLALESLPTSNKSFLGNLSYLTRTVKNWGEEKKCKSSLKMGAEAKKRGSFLLHTRKKCVCGEAFSSTPI